MALPATIVWEVRPTTATSADNGGGFDSAKIGTGTDRSQQAGVQVNIDNAAITCTTPAANSNVLTFTAGYSPVAVDQGNTVAITAGTNINAGIYVINSVVVGTSWTVSGSTNLTTAGGAGSNVTGNMGGARSGFSNGTTTLQSRLLAGHIVWIAKEAWNEAISLTVAGTGASPIQILGYNTARGDVPTLANRPNNNRGGAAGTAFNVTVAGYIVENIIVSNAAGTGIATGAAPSIFRNCRVTACTTGWSLASGLSLGYHLESCEADNNTGAGFNLGNINNSMVVACVARANTGGGFTAMAGCFLEMCLSYGNTGHGFTSASTVPFAMRLSVSDGNIGVAADGLNMGTPQAGQISSCIFSNNGRDGIRMTNGNSVRANFNDFFGNAGAARTGITAGANDVALDPQFTNRAGGDFSIGTNLQALGFPGIFPGALSTGYLDIGAVQRQASPAPPAATLILSPSAVWKW